MWPRVLQILWHFNKVNISTFNFGGKIPMKHTWSLFSTVQWLVLDSSALLFYVMNRLNLSCRVGCDLNAKNERVVTVIIIIIVIQERQMMRMQAVRPQQPRLRSSDRHGSRIQMSTLQGLLLHQTRRQKVIVIIITSNSQLLRSGQSSNNRRRAQWTENVCLF